MNALGDNSKSSRAENTEGSREEKTPGRRFQPGAIKQLFRDVKNALTPKAPGPAQKRKRREDMRDLFKKARAAFNKRPLLALRKMVRDLLQPVTQSGFDFAWWDAPPDYDEHAEYLRMLEMSEQEDFNPQHDNGGFHYVEAEHLSLHL